MEKYEELQRQIDELRSQYERKIKPDRNSIEDTYRSVVDVVSDLQKIPSEVIQQLEAWEAEKKQIWQQIRQSDAVLAGQVRVELQEFSQLQKLIDSPTTAILSFYSAFNHTYIFILRQDSINGT